MASNENNDTPRPGPGDQDGRMSNQLQLPPRREVEGNVSNPISRTSTISIEQRQSWEGTSFNISSSSLQHTWDSSIQNLDPTVDLIPAIENDLSGIPSDVYDAARICNWRSVTELCQRRPEAAAYVGEDGCTALHHACNRRCPDINMMRVLINAYPDALLFTANGLGWTPLHYACRFKSPKEAVQLLLSLHPDKGHVGVSKPDRKGRLPLYYAVRYDAPEGVIGLLLEVDASAVLEEDENADSPLAVIWDDWAEKSDGRRDIMKIIVDEEPTNRLDLLINNIGTMCSELRRLSISDQRSEKARNARERLHLQQKASERWKKINIFLKAAFGFPTIEKYDYSDDNQSEIEDSQGKSSWRVLHAVSAIKCHSSLFLLAICLHPEQAFQLDRRDLRRIENIYKSENCNELSPSNLTALHLAASSHASGDSGKIVLTQLLALNPDAAKCVDTEGSTPLHRVAGNKFKSDWTLDGVEDVYVCHTNAVKTEDMNGRLPLHRASSAITYYNNSIENDTVIAKSKICRLLHVHGDAASHSDHTGCLPMHLVAQNGKTWDVQIQSLHDANPAAVSIRAGVKHLNRLPLHFAAANSNSNLSLITHLIRHHPRAAEQADRKGMFPLHLACESGHSLEIVSSIHTAFPRAVGEIVAARKGRSALHMAAYSKNSDHELISKLAQLHPGGIEVSDTDGRCPLHLACMSGKSWDDGLSSLVNIYSISSRDKNGLLPFHMMAFRNCIESTDDDTARTLNMMPSELDQQSKKESVEATELSNMFKILRCYPAALK